ncbi:MAG: PFL family protein, partial [Clostridia bacterium]|nr:PFL family protein [Clostridia bacterium]
MFNTHDIMETLKMIDHQKLDVRTITMGISLFNCVTDDEKLLCNRVYSRITRQAENLVKVGEAIEREFGVPIVNKRISVTPAALITGGIKHPEKLALALDQAAKETGVDFLGGYSALVQKGMTEADERLIRSIPEALATTDVVCSSINIGSTRAGINMDAVQLMGQIVKQTAERTADRDGLGCAKLVVFCNAVEDNPFMAGAFHGPGEGDCAVSVGVSGPGVVKVALEKVKGQPLNVVAETIKRTAFQITRVGQLVAMEASRRLNVPFGIVDLSLAPTPAVGDSVAAILEEMGLEVCGTHGTTAALAMLNDAVKKGGVMASSNVGGLS